MEEADFFFLEGGGGWKFSPLNLLLSISSHRCIHIFSLPINFFLREV
jgi:hypothetical protein